MDYKVYFLVAGLFCLFPLIGNATKIGGEAARTDFLNVYSADSQFPEYKRRADQIYTSLQYPNKLCWSLRQFEYGDIVSSAAAIKLVEVTIDESNVKLNLVKCQMQYIQPENGMQLPPQVYYFATGQTENVVFIIDHTTNPSAEHLIFSYELKI